MTTQNRQNRTLEKKDFFLYYVQSYNVNVILVLSRRIAVFALIQHSPSAWYVLQTCMCINRKRFTYKLIGNNKKTNPKLNRCIYNVIGCCFVQLLHVCIQYVFKHTLLRTLSDQPIVLLERQVICIRKYACCLSHVTRVCTPLAFEKGSQQKANGRG